MGGEKKSRPGGRKKFFFQIFKILLSCFNTIFMRLFDKHFPHHHKYYKLFNRNNIKLSYSCMPNMNNVIRKHNSKIMINPAPSTTKTCNCHRKTDCPMDVNCLSECLIYKASVITTANKYYYGNCENTIKERYSNHKCSFRNKSREKSTELSKYVWELKEKDINYFINWDIDMKSHKYVCGSRKYDLCICEKLLITRADPNVLLNKRDELVSKCRHRNKFILKCFTDRLDNLYYSVYAIILVFLSTTIHKIFETNFSFPVKQRTMRKFQFLIFC